MSCPAASQVVGRSVAAGGSARRSATSGATPTQSPSRATRITPADDPTVMLHSLSSPPLPGRETVAVHYFAAVAEKAASLAVALAAASDLLEMDDVDVDVDAEADLDEDLSPEPA